LLGFVRRLIRLRKVHPVLRRRRFFHGRRVHGLDVRDIVWLKPNGEEMLEKDWVTHYARSLGMLLNGHVMHEWSESGDLVFDDMLLVLLNAYWEPMSFSLPPLSNGASWQLLVDTAEPTIEEQPVPGQRYVVHARSLVVLSFPLEQAPTRAPRPRSSLSR